MKRILALVALAVAVFWLTRREPEVWEEEVQPWDPRTVTLASTAANVRWTNG